MPKIIDLKKKNKTKSKIKSNEKHKTKQKTSQVIRIYCDHLLYSPFDFDHYRELFAKEGFVLCNQANDADIIMSSYLKYLKKYAKNLERKQHLLLWTHEPYHDFTDRSRIVLDGQKVHVMTVYTGDVFTNNYRYFYFTEKLTPLTSLNFVEFRDVGKTVIAFSTLYPESYYRGNKYTTLPERYRIINWGYQQGRLKVWGKGWGGMAEGESRGDRVAAKAMTLRDYHFNLAIENASVGNYVTEKIWESIASYCLPIYIGGGRSTIYRDFPKDSFIDYAAFKDPCELFQYIERMTVTEYRERLNRCIDVFNRLVEKNLLDMGRFHKCPKNKNLETIDYSQSYDQLLRKLRNIIL